MKILNLFLILLMLHLNSDAQVKTKTYFAGIPKERTQQFTFNSSELKIPAPQEFDKLVVDKDSALIQQYKNKFAIPIKVSIDVIEVSKRWVDSNFVFYSLKLNVEKAKNLSLRFSDFFLSKGATLSIFNEQEITDSITQKQNNINRVWATRLYQRGTLYLTLKVPKEEEFLSTLRISTIFLGFQKMGSEYLGSPGASSSCNVNVLCSEGTGWEKERNAVCLIENGSTKKWSGVLLMNACNTNRPYVLTADHSLQQNTDVHN